MRPALAARFESFLALQALEPGRESIEQVCRKSLELADEAWGKPLAALYVVQDGSGWVIASFGSRQGKLSPFEPAILGGDHGPLRKAIESCEVVRKVAEGQVFPGLEFAGPVAGDLVAIPLTCHGVVKGALLLGWPEQRMELPHELIFMRLTAWSIGTLIGQADLVENMNRQTMAHEDASAKRSSQLGEALAEVRKLYSHSQAQLERLKSFTEISMRINRHAELGPLLDAVAELASRLLHSTFAFTALLQADGTHRVIPEAGHWGLSPRFIEEFTTMPGLGLHVLAFETGGPVCSRDILADPRSSNGFIRDEGWRAEIVAPLVVGERPIGLLTAGGLEPRDWTEDEIEVMRFLASQAASAIDRARTMDELRALDRLKDEVLGIASHELRTPLTAIKGFAAILAADKGEIDADSTTKYARIIDVEADRMIRLVEDMLNVSRIESGRVTLDLHPVEVREAVDQAILSTWGAGADCVEVEVGEEVESLADSDQLVRIMANLLENARKYSDAGARVAVRARTEGDMVEIRVWNEGEPFAPGEIEQLFRKFSRLGRHRASGARGAGLGLYIARQLITAMGGQLWVESTEDGPTFAFSLPNAP